MSCSRNRGNKILGVVSRTDAERLLLELANFRGDTKAAQRLFRRNKGILSNVRGDFDDHQMPIKGWFEFQTLKRRLEKAWAATDARARDWYCFQLRMHFWRWEKQDDPVFRQLEHPGDAMVTVYEDVPSLTPFEATIVHFQTVISDRAKYCLHAGCPAPYFIATKRWQKYCSEECAGPANREAKRRWWHEHKESKGVL